MNMHLSARNPNRKNAHKGGSGPLISTEYSYTIETGQPHYVLDIPKSTNTQQAFIKNTSPTIKTGETSQKSMNKNCPTLTSYVEAFRANRLVSQENEEVLTILGELCSLTSPESLKLSNLDYYCLRTSKDYSLTTKGKLLEQSSPRLMSWGMTSNGKCLTAKTSECRRIGKECSLLDILEENPDPKYFLSEHQMSRMFERGHLPTLSIQATGVAQTEIRNKPRFGQTSRIHKKEGISPTIPTTSGGHHIPMVQESAD